MNRPKCSSHPATSRTSKENGRKANRRNTTSESPLRLEDGFAAVSEAREPFRRLHYHDDIEVSINEHAPVIAMFGAERIVLPPNQLAVFWATRPHGPIETTEGTWSHGIHLPLAWVLQWRLPRAIMRPLLAGQVLLDPPGDRPAADLDLIKSWVSLMRQSTEEGRRIVLLEAEARLRRLAIDMANRNPEGELRSKPLPNSPGALGRFERMAALLAAHFQEPLTVEDIAEAVQMAPTSAMRLFRKFSGMTIHEYLIQQRVSHAQRLLASTDLSMDSIIAKSGFGSPARFYAYFNKLVGQSPAAYRRSIEACLQ